MNVYIPYTNLDEQLEILAPTLEAWGACEDAEPCAIMVDNQLKYRVAADRMSEGKFYILADLGCIPEKNTLIRSLQSKLSDEMGLVGLRCVDSETSEVPKGVRICQKGVVTQWIPRESMDYGKEHVDSVLRTGKKVQIWGELAFKHIGAS